MSKAAIYTVNASAQTVADGGVISPGAIVRRFGNDCCRAIIDLAGNGITICEPGYYYVAVNITDEPTAAGAVTVTLYQDGAAIPGATATNTAGGADIATSVSFGALIRVQSCTTSTITAVLTAGAGNITNAAITVFKL